VWGGCSGGMGSGRGGGGRGVGKWAGSFDFGGGIYCMGLVCWDGCIAWIRCRAWRVRDECYEVCFSRS